MILTQQDLDVRLQLSSCCIGTKTTELLAKIKIGAKDVDCKLQDLIVLQNMIKYLKCYIVEESTINNTLTTSILIYPYLSELNMIQIFIGAGQTDLISVINFTDATIIKDQLNLIPSFYTITIEDLGDSFKLIFKANCDVNAPISYLTSTDVGITFNEITFLNIIQGVCKINSDFNCLTEDQVQSMFEYISKKCNICFQLPNFNYE